MICIPEARGVQRPPKFFTTSSEHRIPVTKSGSVDLTLHLIDMWAATCKRKHFDDVREMLIEVQLLDQPNISLATYTNFTGPHVRPNPSGQMTATLYCLTCVHWSYGNVLAMPPPGPRQPRRGLWRRIKDFFGLA